MSTTLQGNKTLYKRYCDAFGLSGHNQIHEVITGFFSPDANINVVHPFNDISGGDNYYEKFIRPLSRSFTGLHRQDYVLMGGEYNGQDWVSSTGYYVGHFAQDWLTIKATNTLSYLRFGEFHRLENNLVVESYIYLDIPQLMIAANQWPIKDSPGQDRGHTGYLPGPITQDGLLYELQDPAESTKSFKMTSEMLVKLATEDEAWRPYWHPNMIWYGPAAFGSFIGIENFAGFQVPFESAFEGWAGGSVGNGRTQHFIRHGDGNDSCSGGWPSVSGVQVKPFLDQAATHKMIYMRVCDWWRREGDQFVENWVFVDIPHVLLQMGFDVFDLSGNNKTKVATT